MSVLLGPRIFLAFHLPTYGKKNTIFIKRFGMKRQKSELKKVSKLGSATLLSDIALKIIVGFLSNV